MNDKKKICKKIIFISTVIISFVMICFYNILTPYMSDDLMFNKSLYQTFGDIIREEYWQYMNWNGRSVLQIILKIFMILPKNIFNICNSLCYVATMMLIYWNIKGRKEYDVFLYALINLCVWNFSVDFSQTVLWVAGACNYLWGVFIILSFITVYRYYLEKGSEIKYKILAGILLFFSGVLAGWGNENTSGGAILIVLLLSMKRYIEHKKIEKVLFSGLTGVLIGFGFLLLAPGNAIRGALSKTSESYSGFAAYVSRGLKVLKSIDEYLLIYVIVICLVGTYFYYTKKYKLMEFAEVAIYAFAALATAGVLILTTEPMPRAYFGANIYMMIAALQMVQMIREEDTLLISLKTGGIIAATVAMVFVYVEEGANLVRIYREVNIRENYILEVVSSGETTIAVPMLRPEFESKYSMAHLCDVSDDEENWNNEIYKNKYFLGIMEVLPWDEWEERVGIFVICSIIFLCIFLNGSKLSGIFRTSIMDVKVLDAAKIDKIREKEKRFFEEIPILYNDSPVVYDEGSNTIYIPQNIYQENWTGKLEGQRGTLVLDNGEKDIDKGEMIREGHILKLYWYDEETYCEYSLIFTGMPIVSLTTEEIVDENQEMWLGTIEVYDAYRTNAFYQKYDCGFNVRGGSTTKFPKKVIRLN